MSREEEKFEQSATTVAAIFEEVRTSHPKIVNQPFSKVLLKHGSAFDRKDEIVELRWGTKLELSPEDRLLMKQTDIASMLDKDYQSIAAEITAQESIIYFPHPGKPFKRRVLGTSTILSVHYPLIEGFSTDAITVNRFLQDPNIILAIIDRILENPPRVYKVWTREKNPGMFKPPSSATLHN